MTFRAEPTRKRRWHSHIDDDILDFALLWEPLGGLARRPSPQPSQSTWESIISEQSAPGRGTDRAGMEPSWM